MSPEMTKLFHAYTNRLFASASDEYNDHASDSAIKRRYDECEVARKQLVAAIEELESKSTRSQEVPQ